MISRSGQLRTSASIAFAASTELPILLRWSVASTQVPAEIAYVGVVASGMSLWERGTLRSASISSLDISAVPAVSVAVILIEKEVSVENPRTSSGFELSNSTENVLFS